MKKFFLIDDDDNIKNILTNIIENENLGLVVGEASDGLEGTQRWSFYNPDIIIIDYLMPKVDGSEAMKSILAQGFKGKFIMLSQVDDPSMKGKAYECGATFYISKPINYIEVKKILEGVCQTIDLENSLSLIQNTLTGLTSLASEVTKVPHNNMIKMQEKFEKITTNLGIVGESGKKELRDVIFYILNLNGKSYTLKDVYSSIPSDINSRSIEQKIRRLIQKSLHNIAEAGVKDSYDPIFTEYYSVLFDITEVYKEMKYIQKKSDKGGKVSIKKFIEGLTSLVELI